MNKGKSKPGPIKNARSPNVTTDDSKMVMLDDSIALPPLSKGKDHQPRFKIDIPEVIGRTTVDTAGIMESSSPKHGPSMGKQLLGSTDSPEMSKRNTFMMPMSKQSLNSIPEPRQGTNTKLNSVHPTLDNSNFTGSHLIGNSRHKGKGAKLLHSNTSGDLANGGTSTRDRLKQGGLQDQAKKDAILQAQAQKATPWLQKVYEVYNNNAIASQITAAIIMISIFGDDLRRVSLSKSEDVYVDYFMLFLMIFFILEILMNIVIQKKKYLLSFAIVFDVASTLSMVLDMTFIAEEYLNSSDSGSGSAQAASALGARIGKLLRMVRLIRLLRLSKALSKSEAARKTVEIDPNLKMLAELEEQMIKQIKIMDPSYIPPSVQSIHGTAAKGAAGDKLYVTTERRQLS